MAAINWTDIYTIGTKNVPEWASNRLYNALYDGTRLVSVDVMTTNGLVKAKVGDVLLKTPRALLVLKDRDARKYGVK